jgi:hypothetical protein
VIDERNWPIYVHSSRSGSDEGKHEGSGSEAVDDVVEESKGNVAVLEE